VTDPQQWKRPDAKRRRFVPKTPRLDRTIETASTRFKVKRKPSADFLLRDDVLPIVREWIDNLPASPKNDYLRSLVWSKFVSSDTDPAPLREERALQKWLNAEAVNAETNDRLISTPPDAVLLPTVRFSRFVEWVRNFISSIIGDTVPVDVLYGSFSGGASTSRNRLNSHPANKFVGEAHGTHDALNIFNDSMDLRPLWGDLTTDSTVGEDSDFYCTVVDSAEMFFVPKNALIDRVACKEPDINMYLQKGVGRYFYSRLKRVGIDLHNQGINRSLAQHGSYDGSLVTLDLSSASDSVTRNLVDILLPDCWYDYLNSIRSKAIKLPDGTIHKCEMFSTMGNGFTFELESLLFYALSRGVSYFTRTKGIVSVYGDDIICPSACATEVQHVLFYFGFTPNYEKSFVEGPIRESCGGHYHNGVDITPFFIRSPIVRLSDLIHLLNEIRRWAARGESLFLDEECWDIWSLLVTLVPSEFLGGDVVSSGKFQVISPHRPKSRLYEVTVDLPVPELGRYLSDQDSRATILHPMEDQKPRRSTSYFEIRRARYWTWHCCGLNFLAEAQQ